MGEQGVNPMSPNSRLALFTISLIAVVAIGAQPHGVRVSRSMKDMCVCVPAKAGLMVKAAIARTQAGVMTQVKATGGQ
jgi:hypothetical protein